MMLSTKSVVAVAALCLLLVGEVVGEVGSGPVREPPPQYLCLRATAPIRVDGVLDEPDWSPSTATHLVSWDGLQRDDPRTLAWMRWDETNLYVAFDSTDPNVHAEPLVRDAPIYNGEVVEVFIDPRGQAAGYYEFEVNAAASTFDAYFPAHRDQVPGFDAKSWDCAGIATAANVVGTLNFNGDIDTSWTAELAIPFAALDEAGNRPPQVGQTWRMNLYRTEHTPEGIYYLAWSPTLTSKPDFHVPSQFGTVLFAGYRPGVLPFATETTPVPAPAPPPVSISVLIIAIVLASVIALITALKQRAIS